MLASPLVPEFGTTTTICHLRDDNMISVIVSEGVP
jgi:hypothetical protein